MKKKTRNLVIAGTAAVILVCTGGYMFMQDYLGNKIKIHQVIASADSAAAGGSNTANTVPGARNATVSGEQLNGNWAITGDSRVYFSVDTTKEKVNFENDAVNGKWIINLNDAGSMKGQGSIDMSHINSGNEKRDRHLKEPDFFDIEKYPNAEFTASSFEGLLPEWQEGTAYDFTMNGVLTVRGIDKDVTFSGKALYENEQVKLSGTTYVTFGDFGLERPKSVLLSAEKDITVQLELVLKR